MTRRIGVLLAAAFAVHAEVRVLKNFTLIDGTGRPPSTASSMIVDSGKIRWVGPTTGLKAPAGAEVVDLAGAYVMPGMINLHGHVGNTIDLEQNAKFFTRENIEQNLRMYAQYGVTGVISMGTDQDLMFQVRDGQRRGRPSMARVWTAGQGVMLKGEYGGLPGVNEGLTAVAEVKPYVAAQARKKIDFLKLWIDDHVGTVKPKMAYEMAKAVIEEGHRQKLRVLAHVFYLEDAKQLVNFGVDGFVHIVRDQPLDKAILDQMKKQGTWQTAATLSREAFVFQYGAGAAFLSDPFFLKALSPKAAADIKGSYAATIRSDPSYARFPAFLEMAKKNLKALADAGVRYGFGTDTGPVGRFPGYGEHYELELMVQAGLTPQQAILSATRSAAEFLGAKDLGTIEASKWADFIVLEKNPLEDIRNTRTIRAVYIAGSKVN
jgi:imidazolonepropionase-like amidohydrolase